MTAASGLLDALGIVAMVAGAVIAAFPGGQFVGIPVAVAGCAILGTGIGLGTAEKNERELDAATEIAMAQAKAQATTDAKVGAAEAAAAGEAVQGYAVPILVTIVVLFFGWLILRRKK